MDKLTLACKYFPDDSTHIWLAANPTGFSLFCPSCPTFFILFQYYLACCQLLAQEISADILFSALLAEDKTMHKEKS